MYYEAAIAAEDHYVSALHGGRVPALDFEQIAGPHDGQHADAGDGQASLANRAENFNR